LKFIDETNLFKKYRFQIQLGKLIIDKYEKQINDVSYPRTIVEDVKAFGKLSDFEDEQKILQKTDKNSYLLEFEQYAPFYNKRNNKIGLHSGNEYPVLINNPKSESKIKKNLKQPLPEAFLSLHELGKIILLEYLEEGKAEELIHDFISTNNSKIMNWQFIEEVKEKLPKDWNEFQKKADSKKNMGYKPKTLAYLEFRKNTLNKVLAEYNLNHKQIPTRILNYWLNITDVKEERTISGRIKAMKRDCMERLKNLEKYRRERKGKIPKIGEMATFLAKDIVDMIVSEDKKKTITSFYYDKMQECLALYADPEKKSFFIDIVNELKLYEAGGHPFLKNINFQQIKYTPDFYEKYLQEKGKKLVKIKNRKTGKINEKDNSWMANTFYTKEWSEKARKKLTVVKLPENKSNIPFTIRQWEEQENYSLKDWLNHIKKGKVPADGKKPVNLPTNLFDEPIVQLLKEKLETQNIEYPEDANYNELLKIWWNSRDDDVQNFYHAEREYRIYDEPVKFKLQEGARFADLYKDSLMKVFKERKEKRKKEIKTTRRKLPDIQFCQVEKVFKRTISNTEKEIRMVQEQDRIILLMIEKLFDSKNLNIKLNNIQSLLNDTVTVEQAVTGKLSFNDSGERISGTAKPEITRVITDERKRKDYSLLKKFIHDRRLPELFEYFPEQNIAVQELKNELDIYNAAKQTVFDAAFELEKGIIENDTEGIKKFVEGNNGFDNVQHKPYLEWLQNKKLITVDEFTFLNMVRNCFAHNQFPQKKTMEKQLTFENKNFAKQIVEVYQQKTETIMTKL
jgi:hypothetical protein